MVSHEAKTNESGSKAAAYQPFGEHCVSEFSPYDKFNIQPKLAINQPNNSYGHKAVIAADQALRMISPIIQSKPLPIPLLQRKCAHCEEEENLQRKELNGEGATADNDLENYVGNLNSGGQTLPGEVRSFYEPHFGYDFSNVKVHTDSVAAKSAQSINALAYTNGNNIVFNEGQYSPDTDNGKRLLGHELTHVVQQSAANNLAACQSNMKGNLSHAVSSISREEFSSYKQDYNVPEQMMRIEGINPTERTHVFREAIDEASGTPSPDVSGSSGQLYALIENLEQGYAQQASAGQEITADARKNDAIQQMPGFISQIRAAADGNDEALKLSILAGFTSHYINEAAAIAEQQPPLVEVEEESEEIAAMSMDISHPQDAAEQEAVRVSNAIMEGNRASVNTSIHSSKVSRDGGASAALAGLIAFEAGGGAEAEAATGPPGWVVGGLALLAIAGLGIYVAATSSSSRTATCPPCPSPPPPDIDRDHSHYPCAGAHWHYYQYNQNPTTCQCFGPRRLFGGCCGTPGAPC